MPEYVVEKLEREGGRSEVVCTIRENEKAVAFKIVLSMHVEDAGGTMIEPPFRLEKAI